MQNLDQATKYTTKKNVFNPYDGRDKNCNGVFVCWWTRAGFHTLAKEEWNKLIVGKGH